MEPVILSYHSTNESSDCSRDSKTTNAKQTPLKSFGIFVDMMRENCIIGSHEECISNSGNKLQEAKLPNIFNKKKTKTIGYSYQRSTHDHNKVSSLPRFGIKILCHRNLNDRFCN